MDIECLWTLPDGDRDFSKRWQLIESYFSRKCDDKYKPGRLGWMK
jgi:putative transposase